MGNTRVAADIENSDSFNVPVLLQRLENAANLLMEAKLYEFVFPVYKVIIALHEAQNSTDELRVC